MSKSHSRIDRNSFQIGQVSSLRLDKKEQSKKMLRLTGRIIIGFFFVLFLIHNGCNKSPVEPSQNLRQLTWSIDTLRHPDNWQLSILDVWGGSADDVYAVGDANTPRGILWRYKFDRWNEIEISSVDGGPVSGNIDFYDVFGFNKNDVWVCGEKQDESLLIHWDGVNWQEINTPDGHILTSIWGSTPNDVWFAGVNGTIFHYDGISVKNDTIPLNISRDDPVFWTVMSITGNESETHMLLADFHLPNRYLLLGYESDKWAVKDSSFIYNSSRLWMSPSGALYATGLSFYRRNGNEWENILDAANTLWSFGVHGTSDDNLFLVGRTNHNTSSVYHYDGKDWFSYEELELAGVTFYDVWTEGNEVFIVGTDSSKPWSIVVHGK